MAKRGRPRALPVSSDEISDGEAFWRLKAAGFDSYQATRTIGFCAIWQKVGGSVEALLRHKASSRATIYNRLRECHQAGFEPDLVRIDEGDAAAWAALERTMAEQIKQDAGQVLQAPRWIRWAMRAQPYPHLEESEPES
jgi:hypothetical protein